MPLNLSHGTLVVCLTSLGLAGCQQATEGNHLEAEQQISASDARRATGMLTTGDTRACDSEAVKATLIGIIQEDWTPVGWNGWTNESRQDFLDVASIYASGSNATYVDAKLPTMSCEATFHAEEGAESWETRVAYDLHMELDSGGIRIDVPELSGAHSVLTRASRDYERRVILARRQREMDQEAKVICDRFVGRRGEWSHPELSAMISTLGDIPRQYGDSLGTEARECERLISSDMRALGVAAINRNQLRLEREAAAEKALQDARPRTYVEYVGPPVIEPGPPSPRPAVRDDRAAVITNPTWGRYISPTFPPLARAQGLTNGTAAVSCGVRPNGGLSDCDLVSEVPAGVGFGESAIRAAASARVTPSTVDRLAPGGRINFTVRFRDDQP